MHQLLRPALSAIACLIVFVACQREVDVELPSMPPLSERTDKIVTASFQGRVLDASGDPLEGAIATAGGQSTFTDKYGIFRLSGVQVSQQFAYVSVQKSGYFNGSRTVIANTTSANFVQIQLRPKEISGTFNTSNAGIITLGDRAAIDFTATTITTKNGDSYTGKVNVYAATIDPSASNFPNLMPGDLRGIRADSSVTALVSYGMLTVELTGAAGEELQLTPSTPATITMAIPASLAAIAPEEIPLWHFDETDGKWREEGKALKQGNSYSGQVSHFSTWNYDVPENFVFIELTVGGPKLSPVPYTRVNIIDTRNGTFSAVFTDSTGYVRTWVPKYAPLKISIVNSCNQVQLNETVAPLSEDTDLGRYEIARTNMINVIGSVEDCEKSPITSGYVNLLANGLNYRGDVYDGTFSILMSDCKTDGNQMQLYAVNHATNKRGESVEMPLSNTKIDAGVLSACGDKQPDQFAYFKLDGKRHDLIVVNDTLSFHRWGTVTHFHYTRFPSPNDVHTQISIRITDTVPSTIVNEILSVVVNEQFYYPVEAVTLQCTEYGRPGEFIHFTFAGRMSKDSTGPPLPFSGAIRAKREY